MAGDRRRRRRQRPVRPRAGPGVAARQADPARPGRAGAARCVARGLRNPWRFSFDRATGQIVIADVGQDAVRGDRRRRWPPTTAGRAARAARRTSATRGCDGVATADPVLEKPHGGDGFCSITGGYVVRDPGPADAARPLRLRRLLRAGAALGRPGEPGERRGRRALACAQPELVRRGRVRAHPRRLARPGRCSRLVDGTATPCRPSPTPTPTPTAPRARPRDPRRHRARPPPRRAPPPRPRRADRHGRARRPAAPGAATPTPSARRLVGPCAIYDARHRPALARAARLPLRRAAHRRDLPRDDQRARLPAVTTALTPGTRRVVKLRRTTSRARRSRHRQASTPPATPARVSAVR